MRNTIAALLAALLAALPLASQAFVFPAAAMQDTAIMLFDTVHNIESHGPSHDLIHAVCSGFVAKDAANYQIVITARHCMTPDDYQVFTPEHVQFYDGTKAAVVESIASADRDIAALVIQPAKHHKVATFRKAPPVLAETVFTFGMADAVAWNLGIGYVASTGMLNDTEMDLDELPDGAAINAWLWGDAFRTSCLACEPGISGGALYDTEGEVMGTVIGGGAVSSWILPERDIEQYIIDLAPKLVKYDS